VLSHIFKVYIMFLLFAGALTTYLLLIMPSLFHNPTTIKALIILGCSYIQLAIRSKPIRLNIYLGSNNM
jgi:hypothetical protein